MNEYSFDYMNYITNIPSNMMDMSNNYNINQQPNMLNKINIPNINNKNITTEPYEGLIKGNLFKNLYEPYKDYKPSRIDANNERTALLYQIMQYKFAIIELNLYLDNNPNDLEKIELFNKYSNIEKQMCIEYEKKYGPLIVEDTYLNNGWTWNNSPWPWEVI